MKMVTAPEAARAMGVSCTTIKRQARAGKFPFLMLGAHMLVDLEIVQAQMDQAKKERGGIGILALSEAIGLKPSAIRRGVKEGWIPHHLQGGRHYRFVLEDVQAAIQARMMDCGGASVPAGEDVRENKE